MNIFGLSFISLLCYLNNNTINNDIKEYHSKAFYDGLAGKPFKCYYDDVIEYDELEDLDLIVYVHKDEPWSNKYINNLKNDKNKDEYNLFLINTLYHKLCLKKQKME